MTVTRDQARSIAAEGITISYLAILLAGTIMDDPARAGTHVLVLACLAARVAVVLADTCRPGTGEGKHRTVLAARACSHAAGATALVAVAACFLAGPCSLPVTLAGIPVAFFFLPEFMLALVALATLERDCRVLVHACRAALPAGWRRVQNTLKCKADARSIRPS